MVDEMFCATIIRGKINVEDKEIVKKRMQFFHLNLILLVTIEENQYRLIKHEKYRIFALLKEEKSKKHIMEQLKVILRIFSYC